MRKKNSPAGFHARTSEEKPSRPSTGRKPAFKRTDSTTKRTFGKNTEPDSSSEKRKTYGKDASRSRPSGDFKAERPFKKTYRKSDQPAEGTDKRRTSFDRNNKKTEFEKRPAHRTKDTADKPFRKVFRRDESTESKEGSGKRRSGGFAKRGYQGDKPFAKRKTVGRAISYEEVKSLHQGTDKGEQKPFRKTNRPEGRTERPEGRTERPADRKRNSNRGAKSTFAFDGQKQDPPEYNLQSYDKKGRGKPRGRSKISEKSAEETSGDIRLNRYIANAGICSRREADVLIEAGEIKVNGKVVSELGYKIKPGDVVKYGSRTLSREKMVYVLLNKPKDYITTTEDPEERKTVMDLVANACQERIYPVGRLDRNTTGLLILTNDGELAEKLAHPSNEIQKLYEVELDRAITPEDYQAIIDGVELEDGLAKVDDLAIVSPDKKCIGIALHLGRNRIVRRIFEHLGYKVIRLDRTVYAGLTKKDLPRSHWRYLTEKEVVRLKYFV